ncbi:MAG: dihydroorotase [Bifidobacteriaceae bacterium]|jgi:dihydroorotase|nr:dihydroorotase [Bifidobacteriaceae bacterium]
MSIIIKNAKILPIPTKYNSQNSQLIQKDILINNGIIAKIENNIQSQINCQIIDAKKHFVSPGLFDLHSHFREIGFTNKETILTGSQAAAHGGYTSVCTMANLKPIPETVELLQKQIQTNQKTDGVKIHQIAPITINLENNKLTPLKDLYQAGAVGFSNDGKGLENNSLMAKAMKIAKEINCPILAHTQDKTIMGNGVIYKGQIATKYQLPTISEMSETKQLARDLQLAKDIGVHYHICHISTKKGLELVKQAKADNIKVTVEVTPHHLLLCEENIKQNNALYKVNPPLATYNDQQALLEGITNGTIDAIATDHAPHTSFETQTDFIKGAFGFSGIELAFQLLYTNLVKSGLINLVKLIKLMSTNPRKIIAKNNPKIAYEICDYYIKPNSPADICIFDLDTNNKIESNIFFSKGKNTPFLGQKVFGQTILTIVNGKIVYQKPDNDNINGKSYDL